MKAWHVIALLGAAGLLAFAYFRSSSAPTSAVPSNNQPNTLTTTSQGGVKLFDNPSNPGLLLRNLSSQGLR
jgi:hypothetical protein